MSAHNNTGAPDGGPKSYTHTTWVVYGSGQCYVASVRKLKHTYAQNQENQNYSSNTANIRDNPLDVIWHDTKQYKNSKTEFTAIKYPHPQCSSLSLTAGYTCLLSTGSHVTVWRVGQKFTFLLKLLFFKHCMYLIHTVIHVLLGANVIGSFVNMPMQSSSCKAE